MPNLGAISSLLPPEEFSSSWRLSPGVSDAGLYQVSTNTAVKRWSSHSGLGERSSRKTRDHCIQSKDHRSPHGLSGIHSVSRPARGRWGKKKCRCKKPYHRGRGHPVWPAQRLVSRLFVRWNTLNTRHSNPYGRYVPKSATSRRTPAPTWPATSMPQHTRQFIRPTSSHGHSEVIRRPQCCPSTSPQPRGGILLPLAVRNPRWSSALRTALQGADLVSLHLATASAQAASTPLESYHSGGFYA